MKKQRENQLKGGEIRDGKREKEERKEKYRGMSRTRERKKTTNKEKK